MSFSFRAVQTWQTLASLTESARAASFFVAAPTRDISLHTKKPSLVRGGEAWEVFRFLVLAPAQRHAVHSWLRRWLGIEHTSNLFDPKRVDLSMGENAFHNPEDTFFDQSASGCSFKIAYLRLAAKEREKKSAFDRQNIANFLLYALESCLKHRSRC